jgi:hypothetical protein
MVAALLAGAPRAVQVRQSAEAGFVELDAVVVDDRERPVTGLQPSDFSIKDDGKLIAITSFDEVSGPAPADPDSARTLVLLLDDTGVAPVGTQTVQTIARAFVSSASPIDDVPIVRLHVKTDEPFGDRISGDARITAFRGGAWPFVPWSTTGEVLERIRDIAGLVSSNPGKRKIIVCIGSPYICNVREPQPSAPRSFEALWATTLSAAATNNVALYALIPGRVPLRVGGLPEMTGGEVFASSYDVGPPIDRILRDAANYYVLGYWPVSTSRRTHRVEVKVNRRGLKVHARKLR